ncbi:bifunctional indole-3-glycerol-phosphate synthase TrpC/phosphoribosylanthranilate isomerase TrpF [Corynebacterium hindlerae]|uniref:N-(5'-phosphoribosyl)anthranilate isomerase n=1 Tax=Corynebacterium hindlerae TaxID=699041 RepID=A0A7G5FCB5_9CORY|nr:bifunctional indole-3-glycerol-phosphate synthase TrpC/phosphoribosylanthranilate isomerase TrpF [Corynebacterium hindlerae]QMV84256.1 bifunctional indole-3-glycerol-phosphate synthase TrpC/phosphoribosylanthranilate isomerase TrpF [Corynebacterium hindlerae]
MPTAPCTNGYASTRRRTTVLDRIVASRRTQLDDISYGSAPRSERSLETSLLRNGPQFIMECKSASPSLGEIRADYKPAELASIYSRYAAGISVLCEPTWFGGSYAHLATVAATTHLPVLCKDFIVDERQVRAARYYGADAILLMLSVLDDDEYRHLAAVAGELSLDVLTEVVDEDECARANALGARIVGINHRELATLTIDLNRSARLRPLIDAPVVIGESGIRSHDTVRSMDFLDGFLVGSHLSGCEDVDAAARALVFGEHKVCGITSPEIAQTVCAAGATYGGLIFAPESPRNVSRETSEKIMAAEPGLKYVYVTREHSGWDLPDGIHAIQIHGEAADEDALLREARATGVEVWRAVDMSRGFHYEYDVDRIVLDVGNGGTGQTFDWDTIPSGVNAMLAGGLTLDNLTQALDTGLPLDLNSGLEREPGVKDPGAILSAFRTIKEHR